MASRSEGDCNTSRGRWFKQSNRSAESDGPVIVRHRKKSPPKLARIASLNERNIDIGGGARRSA